MLYDIVSSELLKLSPNILSLLFNIKILRIKKYSLFYRGCIKFKSILEDVLNLKVSDKMCQTYCVI